MACCADEAPCQHQDYISRLRNLHFSTIILDPQIMQNSNRGFIKITFSDRKIYIFSAFIRCGKTVFDCVPVQNKTIMITKHSNLQQICKTLTNHSFACQSKLDWWLEAKQLPSFLFKLTSFGLFQNFFLTQFRLQDWKNKRRDVL